MLEQVLLFVDVVIYHDKLNDIGCNITRALCFLILGQGGQEVGQAVGGAGQHLSISVQQQSCLTPSLNVLL